MKFNLITNVRPHQLVHQLALVAIATDLLRAPVLDIGLSLVMATLGLGATLLLNDYLHREIDRRMRRGRPTQRLSGRSFAALFVACLAPALGLAWVAGGARATAACVAIVVTSLWYATAKRRRSLLQIYGSRWAVGLSALVAYWLYFERPLGWDLCLIALASAFMDVAGNLAGDLRDEPLDRAAGVVTAPIRIGIPATLGLLFALQGLAYLVVMPLGWHIMELGALFVASSAISLSLYVALPLRWAHGVFHGPKLVQIIVIASVALELSHARTLVVCVAILFVWWLAYSAYVGALRA